MQLLNSYLKGYKGFILLERGYASNTNENYVRDITQFFNFIQRDYPNILDMQAVEAHHITQYLSQLFDLGLAIATQARHLSALKSFFKYLEIEGELTFNPTDDISAPKPSRQLPDTLSIEEVVKLMQAIDLSTFEGHRNRSILEIMYSSGLRVSEVINLKITNLFFEVGYIRVIGKGNKERIIPIGDEAIAQINLYLKNTRNKYPSIEKNENFVFLNRRGNPLSRTMIFYIIKDAALKAEIHKNVHPHTLRHSFATHMIENGADLKSIQDMLGHESITTTEIYTHVNTQFLRETLEKYLPQFNH